MVIAGIGFERHPFPPSDLIGNFVKGGTLICLGGRLSEIKRSALLNKLCILYWSYGGGQETWISELNSNVIGALSMGSCPRSRPQFSLNGTYHSLIVSDCYLYLCNLFMFDCKYIYFVFAEPSVKHVYSSATQPTPSQENTFPLCKYKPVKVYLEYIIDLSIAYL
jgi:hypothetical protein